MLAALRHNGSRCHLGSKIGPPAAVVVVVRSGQPPISASGWNWGVLR